MLHFMVDLENVRDRGLQGAEYLTLEDAVTIFYSKNCMNISAGKLRQIMDCGCTLDICRLQNTGKNALDFYIASKIGELIGQGFEGVFAIVSNDKGFKAVQDYWKMSASYKGKIILKPDIEQCIVSSNENSLRRSLIQNKLKEVNLEAEYRRWKEREAAKSELKSIFAGTEYEMNVEDILSITCKEKELKGLYINLLKKFGRKGGLEIYRKIKEVRI